MAKAMTQALQQHQANAKLAAPCTCPERGQLEKGYFFVGGIDGCSLEAHFEANLVAASSATGGNFIAGTKLDGIEKQAFDGRGQQLRVAFDQTAHTAHAQGDAPPGRKLADLAQGNGENV